MKSIRMIKPIFLVLIKPKYVQKKKSTCIHVLQTDFVKKNGDSTFKIAFSVTSAIKSDNKLAYTTTTVLT